MARVNVLTGVDDGCWYEQYFGRTNSNGLIWSPFVHLATVFSRWMAEKKFADSKPCWMRD